MSAYRRRLMSIIASQSGDNDIKPLTIIPSAFINHANRAIQYPNFSYKIYVFAVDAGRYNLALVNATNTTLRYGTSYDLFSKDDYASNVFIVSEYNNTSTNLRIPEGYRYLYIMIHNSTESVKVNRLDV